MGPDDEEETPEEEAGESVEEETAEEQPGDGTIAPDRLDRFQWGDDAIEGITITHGDEKTE